MAKKKVTKTKKQKPRKKGTLTKENASKRTRRVYAKSFPIVGIGASAGGLEALEGFFANIPFDTNVAFVVIQHLTPKYKSIMPEILKKYTKMKIFVVEDGMKIEPNCIYLNPPDKEVAIIDRTLYLMEPMERQGIRLPVDYFFRSLSEDQSERSICIILSGTGTDGTLGLKAIKGVGGLTMVQDKKQAKYDGMPGSAINTGLVDFILPVEKMAAELIKYVKFRYIPRPKKVTTADGQFRKYIQKIFILIRSKTGHDLMGYKPSTIQRRTEQRMAILKIDKITDYFQYLLRHPTEVDALFKDLLIRITHFFRDPDAYDVLKNKIMPGILENKKLDTTIRIWVAGCSTGEEAYSIVMVIIDTMNELKKHFNVQVFATDIDEDAVKYARAGIYPDGIAADVSTERLRRFFKKEGCTYRIKENVRKMVIFAAHSLVKDPPFSRLDMISCRNLLIYLDDELQKKILLLFHYALDHDGFLFLGNSETVGRFTDLFSLVDKKWNLYRCRKAVHRKIEELNIAPSFGKISEFRKIVETEADKRKFNMNGLIEKKLVENLVPPCVVINKKQEVIYSSGQISKYLELASGSIDLNILKMAHEDLRFQLRTSIQKAGKMKKIIANKDLQIKDKIGVMSINLVVKPILEPEILQGYMIIVFEDIMPARTTAPVKKPPVSSKKVSSYISELEDNLKSYKEYLDVVTEERDRYIRELIYKNEEIRAIKEELQSANEELQTSREELRSSNEELTTLNTQLRENIDELTQSNNDLSNLLSSTEIGTIFLDTKLCIKRFTQPVTRLFNLVEVDIDRPLRHFSTNILYDNICKDAEDVLHTLRNKETELQTRAGDWYSMRVLPYRTVENEIDGVVMMFVDITKIKQAESALKESEALHRVTLSNISDAVFITDNSGKLIYICPNVDVIFGYSFEEVQALGNIESLISKDLFNHKELEKLGEIRNIEWKLKDKSNRAHDLLINVKHVSIKGGTVLYTCRDITEYKQVYEELQKNEEKYRSVFEQAADTLVMVDADTQEIVEFNENAHKNLGYTREEFKKLKAHDIDVLESYEDVREHIEKIKKEGTDIFETKHRTKNGEIRDVLVSARILSLPGQNFISSIWRDITEQKRTQERINKMAEEWESTFNFVADPISIHDKDFKFLRANKSYADLFNKNPQELIGKTCYEVIHGTKEPWPDCPHIQAMKSKRPTITEFFEPHLGIYLEVSASPIFDDKGEVIRSVHIMKDVTERKRVEAEVKSQARFPSENPNPVLRIDTKGVILYANKSSQPLLKEWKSEVGLPLYSDLMKTLKSSYKSRRVREIETASGDRILSLLFVPVTGTEYVNVYGRDITEHKKADSEYQKTIKELKNQLKEKKKKRERQT